MAFSFAVVANIFFLLVAFLLPCLHSFRAVHPKRSADGKAAQVKWLRYWTVFGLLHFVNSAFSALGLNSSSMENDVRVTAVKTVILLWLQFPDAHGATFIFTTLLGPLLGSQEAHITSAVAQTMDVCKGQALRASRAGLMKLPPAVTTPLKVMLPGIGGDGTGDAQPTAEKKLQKKND
eukprot:NODE_5209_length_705_cov_25.809451_g4840_i0.p1 GENE.NODE_5209_length_705_cov_25.809451_g4840_i0~~NODE_5209_length_705_cov_25.809451_g4840_i0.p1  ORF type:complete len:178 (-),score=33.60 NODE_5209_length_705_cov_25.809451_g4840_i0:48-581(-)